MAFVKGEIGGVWKGKSAASDRGCNALVEVEKVEDGASERGGKAAGQNALCGDKKEALEAKL